VQPHHGRAQEILVNESCRFGYLARHRNREGLTIQVRREQERLDHMPAHSNSGDVINVVVQHLGGIECSRTDTEAPLGTILILDYAVVFTVLEYARIGSRTCAAKFTACPLGELVVVQRLL